MSERNLADFLLWASEQELVEEVKRLRAAVDAALALPRWDHLDAYEEVTGQCVDVDDLRRALAPVADPGPHTTSHEEATP